MKTISVYGTGCAKCGQLTDNIREAVKGFDGQFSIEKVSDIQAIVKAGVMNTPAFGVEGKLLSSGKLLSPAEIQKLLGI